MRMSIVLTLALAATAVLAGTSRANPPLHVRAPLSISAPSPDYSAACGFPVILSANGMLDVTVHTNPDGSVREQDVFPGLSITVSAPSTGRSFSHVFGPTTYLYPDGVYVGASAVITSYGVRGDAPGIPPDAGRVVMPGVVVALVPDVGPITLPAGPPVAQSGNFEDPARVVAAICAALAE
jgi:hypothetical protein